MARRNVIRPAVIVVVLVAAIAAASVLGTDGGEQFRCVEPPENANINKAGVYETNDREPSSDSIGPFLYIAEGRYNIWMYDYYRGHGAWNVMQKKQVWWGIGGHAVEGFRHGDDATYYIARMEEDLTVYKRLNNTGFGKTAVDLKGEKIEDCYDE